MARALSRLLRRQNAKAAGPDGPSSPARRDFLKLAGITAAATAFGTPVSAKPPAPYFAVNRYHRRLLDAGAGLEGERRRLYYRLVDHGMAPGDYSHARPGQLLGLVDHSIAVKNRAAGSWYKDDRGYEKAFTEFGVAARDLDEPIDLGTVPKLFLKVAPLVRGESFTGTAKAIAQFCRKNVAYWPSSFDRTQPPLATLRRRGGNDWDASAFLVSAYRSVGIPARVSFVPAYAGYPEGMAWVEIYAGKGKWEPVHPVANPDLPGTPLDGDVLHEMLRGENRRFNSKVYAAVPHAVRGMSLFHSPRSVPPWVKHLPGLKVIDITNNWVEKPAAIEVEVRRSGKPAGQARVLLQVFNIAFQGSLPPSKRTPGRQMVDGKWVTIASTLTRRGRASFKVGPNAGLRHWVDNGNAVLKEVRLPYGGEKVPYRVVVEDSGPHQGMDRATGKRLLTFPRRRTREVVVGGNERRLVEFRLAAR